MKSDCSILKNSLDSKTSLASRVIKFQQKCQRDLFSIYLSVPKHKRCYLNPDAIVRIKCSTWSARESYISLPNRVTVNYYLLRSELPRCKHIAGTPSYLDNHSLENLYDHFQVVVVEQFHSITPSFPIRHLETKVGNSHMKRKRMLVGKYKFNS